MIIMWSGNFKGVLLSQSMEHILHFFNTLRTSSGAIWVENGLLRLSTPKELQNNQTKDFLSKNKEDIISILQLNQILNKTDFADKIILTFGTHTSHYQLSYGQERLWFIEKLNNGSGAYNVPLIRKLDPDIDLNGIEFALQAIVERHEILRTTIDQPENLNYAVQKVNSESLKVQRVTLLNSDEVEIQIRTETQRHFDLTRDYPIRAIIFQVISGIEPQNILVVTRHHIASDAWSTEIFRRDLTSFYNSYINKSPAALPDLSIQYKDYALWQRTHLSGTHLENQIAYWKNYLDGHPQLELPIDHQRPPTIVYKGNTEELILSEGITISIRNVMKSLAVTLNTLVLGSVAVFLSKITGQNDIVTGSPISNRDNHQTENLIGFFVNTLVNRTLIKEGQTFRDIVQQVHQNQIEAQRHQELPFEKLVDELNVERDMSRHPVFQVMVNVIGKSRKSTKQNFEFDSRGSSSEVAKFDLSVVVSESTKEITVLFNYATALFRKETIARFIRQYKLLLEQLISDSHKPLAEISLLTKEEFNKIIYAWNSTQIAYPDDRTIGQLFSEQARRTPEHTAIIFNNEMLSYAEIEKRSNQLANYILKCSGRGVNQLSLAGSFIPVLMDRTPDMIIGLLAILKTGAAYVPLDASYPKERIIHILLDTKATEILCHDKYIDTFNVSPQVSLTYIKGSYKSYSSESSLPLKYTHSDMSGIAYVIYTSGTTGHPKGVKIQHRAVASLAFNNYIRSDSEDTFAFLSSPVFDAATFEIWTPLLQGFRLAIPSSVEHVISTGNSITEFLTVNKVTVLWLTKTLFDTVYHIAPNVFSPLRYLIIGGEALDKTIVSELISGPDKPQFLLNGYGPTESTTFTTVYNVTHPINTTTVPIGKPIGNRTAYVLDNKMMPQPIGIKGELYIGGAGLADGYLNQPGLTEQQFITNPFATEKEKESGNARLYKTGDMVRWLPEGNLEFLGRMDNQVKIRGYRIELGEIETAFHEYSGITQACVIVREKLTSNGSSRYLAAYYVTLNGQSVDQQQLLEFLGSRLPGYMIPAVLIDMPQLPLTSNGKLDKASLPNVADDHTFHNYIAPSTPEERDVCNIWKNILGHEKIGITDNFFQMGGNSILAILISHRMSKILQADVLVSDIFMYKTISRLLKETKNRNETLIPKAIERETLLSYAQERLWFIEQYEGGTDAYHISLTEELDPETDIHALKYALEQVVLRHEVLRSTIRLSERTGEAIQFPNTDPLSVYFVQAEDEIECKSLMARETERPFDLSKEYPMRAAFYTVNTTGGRYMLVTIHHIACDGWSLKIFRRELSHFYDVYVKGEHNSILPPLEIQYKDYALWQRQYLTGETLAKQKQYWLNKLAGYEMLQLPLDFVRPLNIDYRGTRVSFKFNKILSDKLRASARQQGTTLYGLLLSAFYILLQKYSGQQDLVVGNLMANRHHKQTQDLIGFFVNTQVSRITLNVEETFADLVSRIHADQVLAQLHQDLPFEKLVDYLEVERDASRHPIFQVVFGVQGFGDKDETQAEEMPEAVQDLETRVAKFDLSLFINDQQKELTGHINYAISLFRQDTIQRLIKSYTQILEQVIEDPDILYEHISVLSKEEKDQQVFSWNATDKTFPDQKTLPELFADRCMLIPDQIACVSAEQALTYKMLDEKSNQLARYLQQVFYEKTNTFITNNELIILYIDRSVEMIVAMLAILKTGAAYVTIDLEYPDERINYIIKDTEAKLILSQRHLEKSRSELFSDKVLYIDLSEQLYTGQSTAPLKIKSSPTNLAYVIYTSGTTGEPKGVMIEQRSVSSLVFNDFITTGNSDVFVFLSSPAFDAATFEIWTPLLRGGKLVIPSDLKSRVADPDYFRKLIHDNHISVLWLTKTLFETIYYSEGNFFKGLKYLIIGGEALDQHVVKSVVKNPDRPTHFLNGYGPTESTTFTCTHDLYQEISSVNVPIGKAINNRKVYVLDAHQRVLPIGVVGELYIGGNGLSRGYLNQPELTAQKFIPNLFDENKRSRLYRTGDLVRWLPDGSLEFIGRNDYQVKIRGYRIELCEIEKVLSEIKHIRQARVIEKENTTNFGTIKHLVAYYITSDSDMKPEYILNQLSKKLPAYMIPSCAIPLEVFPLTSNGKLDTRMLPEARFEDTSTEYQAPSSDLERRLCELWESVLGIKRVGITDDFFRIGGNSILAIRIAQQMSKMFRHSIKVSDIFRLKTIDKIQNIPTDQAENLVKRYHAVHDHNLPDLIFIPPARAGSEMYQALADGLSGYFNCVGVDNYNLQHEIKIRSLNALALKYLNDYEERFTFSDPIQLIGWSLGGQISLEMACILEYRGFRNIRVTLLDTYIRDRAGESISVTEDFNFDDDIFQKYGSAYALQVKSAFEAEHEIAETMISRRLLYTNVTLFKALRAKPPLKIYGESKPSDTLAKMHATNNVDSVTDNLTVIGLDCDHKTIMAEKSQIVYHLTTHTI